jgi:molecular chaperone GrpE
MFPGVVDVESARRAVAQVARERDALAQQLQRAQSVLGSLKRQLDARTNESAELARAVRALQGRGPAAAEELDEERARNEQVHRRLQQLAARHERVVAQLDACVQERDLAIADRDRGGAALAAARAEVRELEAASPDAGRAQRLAEDLARVRRHQVEAIERGVRSGTDHLLVELVSVRDSVRRALQTLPGAGGSWHDGLLAVLARVDHVLEREGVHVVGHPGELFDPHVHAAVGQTDGPGGAVVETVSSGLVRADGSVMVPAKVLVGGGV